MNLVDSLHVCVFFQCADHNINDVYVYSGLDVMDHFFKHINREHQEICEILEKNEAMLPLDDHEVEEYT